MRHDFGPDGVLSRSDEFEIVFGGLFQDMRGGLAVFLSEFGETFVKVGTHCEADLLAGFGGHTSPRHDYKRHVLLFQDASRYVYFSKLVLRRGVSSGGKNSDCAY